MDMDASDGNVLRQVRALIDARIAARDARAAVRVRRLAGAPRMDRVCMCESRPQSFGSFPIECASLCRRLPDGLRVPSAAPRPPDLHAANLSFAARLVIAVRDRFGGDAPRVYEAARVTRAAYSQIVSDETHKVSKRTAIRFAFALRLDPEEARLLLKSAGYAFSHSQTEDFILLSCLEANPPIHDFETVNALLREYRVDYQY